MNIPCLIHATHEAGVKIGGIGAVLDGLLSADTYNRQVERTLLVGPMEASNYAQMARLTNPRNRLTIHYSSMHGIFDNVSETERAALQAVEQNFEVALLYGTRQFGSYRHEILLVDATSPAAEEVNRFKYHVWKQYGIESARYDWHPEYNLYFTIAQPLFSALKALNVDANLAPNQKFILAHEWLGMPLVFAAQMAEPDAWRTIFYAHETATARQLVEEHSGHDTRFYNALNQAKGHEIDLEMIFGHQDNFFKDEILKQAATCDAILAVGDLVVDELRFMGGALGKKQIDLVYNGIPSVGITVQEKLESKRRLQKYCENILGYVPDYIFTHVTRLVLSKALWRDLRVMTHLDDLLREADKRAVLFVLSTSVPAGRASNDIHKWEAEYGWPVGHRADNGDLIDGEVPFFFDGVAPFNQQATHCQAVLINQFGWSQEQCGERMPPEMEFMDVRKGSDVEFGQSIYEPFGIAQVEPLSFGALCCVSNVCGCVGFVQRATEGLAEIPNLVVADYTTLPEGYELKSPYDALRIEQGTRNWLEETNSVETAKILFERLPKDQHEMNTLLTSGRDVAKRMSWDVVVAEYLLPVLDRLSS